MIQAGGHDGAELVGGKRSDEVEHGRSGTKGQRNKGTVLLVTRMWNYRTVLDVPFSTFPLLLQPQQQPQDLHPGKRVRLCQAEALRAAVNHALNIFGNLSHRKNLLLH